MDKEQLKNNLIEKINSLVITNKKCFTKQEYNNMFYKNQMEDYLNICLSNEISKSCIEPIKNIKLIQDDGTIELIKRCVILNQDDLIYILDHFNQLCKE